MKPGHWLQGPEQEDHSIVLGGGPTLSFYSATPFEGQLSIVFISFHFLSCPFISLHFLSMSCHFHLVPSQVLLISLSLHFLPFRPTSFQFPLIFFHVLFFLYQSPQSPPFPFISCQRPYTFFSSPSVFSSFRFLQFFPNSFHFLSYPLARQTKLGHWLQGPEQEDHSIVLGGGPTLSFYSATPFGGQLSIVFISFHFLSFPFISFPCHVVSTPFCHKCC